MKTSSIQWNVYNEIKRRILFFEYEPGRALNEKELTAEFEVSRTPVREALLRLEWERLITIMPRAAILVSRVDFQEARDIFLNRIFVEGSTGWFAARNLEDRHLADMESLSASCRNLRGGGIARNELIDLDIRFRDVLFDAAKSPANKDLSNHLYNQTLRIWFLTFEKTDIAEEVEIEEKEIQDSLEVFSKRDPEKAETFKRNVIHHYLERISKYFTAY